MDKTEIKSRMAVLARPIEQQILMCDTREELLMIACVMLQRVGEIFTQEMGADGCKKMFKDYV
jgi:hypothetical protein